MSQTDDIERALRMLNQAYAAGQIAEADYEAQDARLRTRQGEIRAWREGSNWSGPTNYRQPRLPFQPPRRQLRADLPERLLRRRGLAYAGMLPPAVAKTFTVGQAAVLAVIAWEVLHHGACRKSYAEVADEAGCSREWVKRTIRQAGAAGLLTVEHRPCPGRKSQTNILRIVSTDWLAWIRTRRERIERGRKVGETRVSTSPNSLKRRGGYEGLTKSVASSRIAAMSHGASGCAPCN